jgi:tetratricopeptide (TPR) repeat protein
VLLGNWGYSCYNEGDWSAALAHFAAAEAALERSGHLMQRAAVVNNRALVLLDQGHLDAAEEAWQDATRTLAACGIEHAVAVTTTNLARVAARQGRYDDARSLLHDARERLARLGMTERDAELATYELERLVLSGRFASACRYARVAFDALGAHEAPVALQLVARRLAAEAQLGAGRLRAGTASVLDVLALAREQHSPHDELCCLHALKAVRRFEGAALEPADQRAVRALTRGLGVTALAPVIVNPSSREARRHPARSLVAVAAT